ncbi:hypothetical protein [Streptomyces sp. NPDC050856]|uniref:hypothetical protein n=1 Tax=Streptomyces sp. NPDC050856 TaxID=3154939 RepID=UPI003403A693
MDDFSTRVLLTLRRFIGVPLPGTDYYIHAAFPLGSCYRVRVENSADGSLDIDLPKRLSDGEQVGTWWCVGVLRRVVRMAYDGDLGYASEGDGDGRRVIDVSTLVSAGDLPRDADVTAQDTLDYVISDLAGDPLWHDAAASAAPDLYQLVGFDLRTPTVVRVYLSNDNRTIGVDLALYDSETGLPRNVGWWASAKLIAILNPDDHETLAVHRVQVAVDPVCDAIYDLSRWA